MGAGASFTLFKGSFSSRLKKPSRKVQPEPRGRRLGPVFGVPLAALKEKGQLVCGVPWVLRDMVDLLDKHALQQKGLFRLSGSVVKTGLLKARCDQGEALEGSVDGDFQSVACLLKLFLRELPLALIPAAQRTGMVLCLRECTDELTLNHRLKEQLSGLPEDNYNILSYLCDFLLRVASHSQANHMTVENLATVFGPCLFHVPQGPGMLEEQSLCNAVVRHLLKNHAFLMGGDLDTPSPPPVLPALSIPEGKGLDYIPSAWPCVCERPAEAQQPDVAEIVLPGATETQELNTAETLEPNTSELNTAETLEPNTSELNTAETLKAFTAELNTAEILKAFTAELNTAEILEPNKADTLEPNTSELNTAGTLEPTTSELNTAETLEPNTSELNTAETLEPNTSELNTAETLEPNTSELNTAEILEPNTTELNTAETLKAFTAELNTAETLEPNTAELNTAETLKAFTADLNTAEILKAFTAELNTAEILAPNTADTLEPNMAETFEHNTAETLEPSMADTLEPTTTEPHTAQELESNTALTLEPNTTEPYTAQSLEPNTAELNGAQLQDPNTPEVSTAQTPDPNTDETLEHNTTEPNKVQSLEPHTTQTLEPNIAEPNTAQALEPNTAQTLQPNTAEKQEINTTGALLPNTPETLEPNTPEIQDLNTWLPGTPETQLAGTAKKPLPGTAETLLLTRDDPGWLRPSAGSASERRSVAPTDSRQPERASVKGQKDAGPDRILQPRKPTSCSRLISAHQEDLCQDMDATAALTGLQRNAEAVPNGDLLSPGSSHTHSVEHIPTANHRTANLPTANLPSAKLPTANNHRTANLPTTSLPTANLPTAKRRTTNSRRTANLPTANRCTANNRRTANNLPTADSHGASQTLSPPDTGLDSVPRALGPEKECYEGQGPPSSGRLLLHITDSVSPLPSPGVNQGQRFHSNPETAPSPPRSQPFIKARPMARTQPPESSTDTLSISLLTKHIQALKRKIRRFEEQFELERNYRPSHNDRTINPEVFQLMSDLAKSRKQLRDLRRKQSVEQMRAQKTEENGDICSYSSDQQGPPEQSQKPSLEDTLEALLKRLGEKRQALGLPDNMKEMTQKQVALEKITLQKCLLYFESLHGRPGTRHEKSLMKPLYDRYRTVKQLLCTAVTPVAEEDSSDDDSAQRGLLPSCGAIPRQCLDEPASPQEKESDATFVSLVDEVNALRQPAVTVGNRQEASRPELLQCLRETRAEKKKLRKGLWEFEEQFYRQTGRTAQKEDRIPMAEEYQEYKNLKAKLRRLEALLSKQEARKII